MNETLYRLCRHCVDIMDGWNKITPELPPPGVRVIFASDNFAGEGYRSGTGVIYRHSGVEWLHAFGEKPTLWMPMPTVGKENKK